METCTAGSEVEKNNVSSAFCLGKPPGFGRGEAGARDRIEMIAFFTTALVVICTGAEVFGTGIWPIDQSSLDSNSFVFTNSARNFQACSEGQSVPEKV